MFLILTMAGRYQRFLNEGFKTPKYLLPWGKHTILAELLSNLNKDNIFSGIILVANERDEPYMPHVRAVMKSNNISINNLVLTHDTSGQVETTLIGLRALERIYGEFADSVVVHNIDTIILNRNMRDIKNKLLLNGGYIDIFEGSDKGYSYILINGDNKVTEIVEKVVVSDLATSGFYGFSSPNIFKKYLSSGDIFISSIFKKMIENGESVIAGNKHSEKDTIVLGTPQEYMNASLVLL